MRRKYVKILTGIAIVLIALGPVYAIWVGVSAAKLRRAYGALEKDGRPMRAEEVIPPKVPETENAALLYESAALLLKAMPAPWKDVPDSAAISVKESIERDKLKNLLGYLGNLSNMFLNESLEEDKRGELEELLAEDVVMQALSTVKLGTERPSCRFDLDYDAGLNMPMSPVLDLRDLLRILGAKARFEAEAGRSQSAWDLASAQLKFADALRTEPLIMSQIIRVSEIEFTCRTLQWVCAVAPPNLQQYGDLDRLLEGLDDIAPLIVAMDGDRLLQGEWAFRQRKDVLKAIARPHDGKAYVPDIFYWFRYQRTCFKPMLLADHAAYLHLMHEKVRFLELPYSPTRMAALEEAVTRTEKHHVLTGSLGPTVGRMKEVHTQMTAAIRITRAGLALLRYKDTHDVFSKTLDNFQLEGLNDPFSEGPLRYRSETDGFLLYSLAADQKDNGGSPQEPKQETGYDIVWRFPSQPTR